MNDYSYKNDDRFDYQPGEFKLKIGGDTEATAENINKRYEMDELEAYNKYMPLGSVVELTEYNDYMIVGYNSEKGKDYIGCNFPFGVKNEYPLTDFNHDEIISVYKIGYICDDSISYRKMLKEEAEADKHTR